MWRWSYSWEQTEAAGLSRAIWAIILPLTGQSGAHGIFPGIVFRLAMRRNNDRISDIPHWILHPPGVHLGMMVLMPWDYGPHQYEDFQSSKSSVSVSAVEHTVSWFHHIHQPAPGCPTVPQPGEFFSSGSRKVTLLLIYFWIELGINFRYPLLLWHWGNISWVSESCLCGFYTKIVLVASI